MFNSWSQFVVDFELVDSSSVHSKKTAWDQLFIAVDAAADRAAKAGSGFAQARASNNAVMELAGAKQKALERGELPAAIGTWHQDSASLPALRTPRAACLRPIAAHTPTYATCSGVSAVPRARGGDEVRSAGHHDGRLHCCAAPLYRGADSTG